MRISDCISDVCSSDLPPAPLYVRREPPSARYTQPPSAGSATMTEQPKQTLNEAQDNAPAAAEAEPVDTRPVDPTTGRPLAPAQPAVKLTQAPGEEDGPKGPEPTRYGDWERKGIVSDF